MEKEEGEMSDDAMIVDDVKESIAEIDDSTVVRILVYLHVIHQ